MNIYDILTSDAFEKAITVILSTVITFFFITRYSANRPKKLDVKEKQFEQVYLPLYKSLCLVNKDNLSSRDLAKYSCKLQRVLNDNYELAFPQLHTLSNSFHKSLKDPKIDSMKLFSKILYRIEKDYTLLKRDLGYPSLNLFSMLRRMSIKDRINYICGKLVFPSFAGLMLSPIIVGIIDKIFNISIYTPVLLTFGAIMIISLWLYVISSDDKQK